jgi:hypothetical protein
MNAVGSIPAVEAHIWWDDERRLLAVVPFGPGQCRTLTTNGYTCDAGASEASWREATQAERLRLLYEMAIEFMVAGHDPKHVVREFAKVREFAELGGKSYPMARALTEAIEGQAVEDPARFAERHLR